MRGSTAFVPGYRKVCNGSTRATVSGITTETGHTSCRTIKAPTALANTFFCYLVMPVSAVVVETRITIVSMFVCTSNTTEHNDNQHYTIHVRIVSLTHLQGVKLINLGRYVISFIYNIIQKKYMC